MIDVLYAIALIDDLLMNLDTFRNENPRILRSVLGCLVNELEQVAVTIDDEDLNIEPDIERLRSCLDTSAGHATLGYSETQLLRWAVQHLELVQCKLFLLQEKETGVQPESRNGNGCSRKTDADST